MSVDFLGSRDRIPEYCFHDATPRYATMTHTTQTPAATCSAQPRSSADTSRSVSISELVVTAAGSMGRGLIPRAVTSSAAGDPATKPEFTDRESIVLNTNPRPCIGTP